MGITEVFDHVSGDGSKDFERVIEICRDLGDYCLIGGLAVNCYVEPVYTMDAEFALALDSQDVLSLKLEAAGFRVELFPHSLNAQFAGRQLRIQFSRDPRYRDFPSRAQSRRVLGQDVRVACLEDIVRGKTWAWMDNARRLSKREKDRLDLIRIGESHPELVLLLPPAIQTLLKP